MEITCPRDGHFRGNYLAQGKCLCAVFDATSGVESLILQGGVSNCELPKIYH